MKISTESLARASAAHPWRVIAMWLVASAAAIVVIGLFLGSALTTEQRVMDNPESARAERLLEEAFPFPTLSVDEVVVVRGADPQIRAKQIAAEIEATEVVVSAGPVQTSQDGGAALIPITMQDSRTLDPEETIEDVIAIVERADGDRFDVTITGTYTTDRDFVQLSQDDLRTGELYFGMPAALVILMLVFGAIVAGLIPLALALVSIVIALALTALVGQAFELSFFVVNMLTGFGLALGIDYSLFTLSRFREERAHGREKLDAIATAGATSSRAVLFSGIAVILALLGMVLVPDLIMRSLGLGAILVGIVAVLAALTLLPAILSLLGDRVNSLRIPFLRGTAGAEGRFWSRIVRGVLRRPVVSLVAGVALLLAAATPVVDLETGFAGISTLPDRFTAKQGFDAYTEEFGGGATEPAWIVVDRDLDSPPVNAGAENLVNRLRRDGQFGSPTAHSGPADAFLLSVPVRGDPNSDAAIAAVERLRDEYIPVAFSGVDARVLVGGETAEAIDYFALVDYWLPIVFAFVLGLSFVLLMLVFRSIVVPLKAILLNLLSVGAAYGLLVLVFQKGVGNDLLGFQQVENVEAWVPLFLFSVLFGLSMDYHVFLLSRIRERYLQTGDNDEAVATGVGSTARLITGAALIIIAVFAGFARGDLVMFQQMGFGVAVSLLIDATLIRSVLVPASMKLLGERNWYLPSWLTWLPELRVEGRR